jgi:hypothetical protein
MTRRGGAGKGSGSKGCRGAEHGQACTKERTDAVAVRAAHEWAVQVGRGNEGNRQAETANPTKCRNSLQKLSVMSAVTSYINKKNCLEGPVTRGTTTNPYIVYGTTNDFHQNNSHVLETSSSLHSSSASRVWSTDMELVDPRIIIIHKPLVAPQVEGHGV